MNWEYMVQTFSGNSATHEALNAYGRDGWELVSVAYYGGGYHLFLKRPFRED
jgi:hypothetical protein